MSLPPRWFESDAGPARRRWLVALPVAGVLAVGLGAAAMARLPAPAAPATGGGTLRIEVVQPPAPRIQEGPRMGVGELVDGYRHIPAVQRRHDSAADELFAWLEPLAPPPLPEPPEREWARPVETAVIASGPPEPAYQDRRGDPYGFDAPRPDYAAARAARRERLERIERERERFAYRREAPWRRAPSRPDPDWRPVAELPRESVFY